MSLIGWIVIGILGFNLLFFGSLAIVWTINHWKEHYYEKRKAGS